MDEHHQTVRSGTVGQRQRSHDRVTVEVLLGASVFIAELVPILESERKRLKAEIPDMVRRGGAYRTAFA